MPMRGISRRTFVAGSLAAGALLATPRRLRAQLGPRIVVVGGGLAGLSAAHQLSTKYRLRAEVFEAQAHLGGRCATIRGLPGGQWAERGGQLVSSREKHIRRLVKRLRLRLIDTFKVYPEGPVAHHFLGQHRPESQITTGLDGLYRTAGQQVREIVWMARHDFTTPRTEEWDARSVADWIEEFVPGGLGSVLGQYVKVYFETLYGGPVGEASALHLIYDFTSGTGGYDERYVVDGGSDGIVGALAATLPPDSIHLGTALTALAPNPDGSVRCTFDAAGGGFDVDADEVVLALPFTVLRDVDYAAMGFSALKQTAIEQMGMGVNAKLHFQLDHPAWEPASDGESYSDLVLGATWPGQVGLPGAQGLLIAMNGNDAASAYAGLPAHGAAPPSIVTSHLAAIDTVFPGASSAFDGTATLDNWPEDPWVKGSYSYYRRGQFTGFRGVEGVAEGRVHFAGEHTATYASLGTMNGAIESGERVAKEVRTALRRRR